jgi:hypothetical protein
MRTIVQREILEREGRIEDQNLVVTDDFERGTDYRPPVSSNLQVMPMLCQFFQLPNYIFLLTRSTTGTDQGTACANGAGSALRCPELVAETARSPTIRGSQATSELPA